MTFRTIYYFISATYPIWACYAMVLIIGFFDDNIYKFPPLKYHPFLFLITSPLIVPGIIIFINYLNYGSHVRVDSNKRIVCDTKNEEIKKITLHHRYFKNETYFSILPWDNFYYFEITTKSETHYLTCLRYRKDQFEVDESKNEKFPSIKIGSKADRSIRESEKENNRYLNYFATKSDKDLRNITSNPSKYNPLAVDAASEILKTRDSSDGDADYNSEQLRL